MALLYCYDNDLHLPPPLFSISIRVEYIKWKETRDWDDDDIFLL